MPSIEQIIKQKAAQYGLPPEYLRALIQVESKGNPNAVSPTGARGLTQVTRGTGAAYGLNRRNAFDPEANIDATARLAVDNKRALTKVLGRDPSPDELYLGHLQGAGGASSAFRNPDARAIDVLNPKHVRVNLPQSQRGRLNEITAREFQDIHRGNFNRAMGRNVDIGDKPTLENLNPPSTNRSLKGDRQSTIPLSQLAPTEESNQMARSRYPDYNEAIRRSLPDIRGEVQLAGAVPTKTPRVKSTAAQRKTRMDNLIEEADGPARRAKENAAVRKAAEDEAAGVGPHKNVPGTKRQMEGNYSDYVKAEKERMATEKAGREQRANELKSVPNAGQQIEQGVGSTADIQPRSVRTSPITKATTAAGTAGVGAVAAANRPEVDPAVAAVQRAIDPPIDDTGGVGVAQQPASPQPVTRGAPVTAPTKGEQPYKPRAMSIDQDMMKGALGQIAPVIQEVMKDPQAGPAAQVVLKKAAEIQAQRDGARADMQKDPTYYQYIASQRSRGGGDPLDDRAMERAVMMDNQARMQSRAPSARGVSPAAQQARSAQPQQAPVVAKDESRVPIEQEIVARNMNGGYGPGELNPLITQQSMSPNPEATNINPMMPPQITPQMMDPTMMQLMQFFSGGGDGVG